MQGRAADQLATRKATLKPNASMIHEAERSAQGMHWDRLGLELKF
jgi:hypothetical protein